MYIFILFLYEFYLNFSKSILLILIVIHILKDIFQILYYIFTKCSKIKVIFITSLKVIIGDNKILTFITTSYFLLITIYTFYIYRIFQYY